MSNPKKTIPFLALLLTGCFYSASGPDAAHSNTANADDQATTATAATPAPAAAASGAPAPRFEKLAFDAKSLPAGFKYDGRITGGARWSDANGENTLIVSEKSVAAGDIRKQQIFGYLYAVKDGQTRLLWKIQDFADNYCDNGRGLTSPVEARDIDGDGVAENLFAYNLEGGCDVSPIAYKLMMHSGAQKLAVRGTNGVAIKGYEQKSEKNFDAEFDNAPKAFREAASEFWDRHVKPLE